MTWQTRSSLTPKVLPENQWQLHWLSVETESTHFQQAMQLYCRVRKKKKNTRSTGNVLGLAGPSLGSGRLGLGCLRLYYYNTIPMIKVQNKRATIVLDFLVVSTVNHHIRSIKNKITKIRPVWKLTYLQQCSIVSSERITNRAMVENTFKKSLSPIKSSVPHFYAKKMPTYTPFLIFRL